MCRSKQGGPAKRDSPGIKNVEAGIVRDIIICIVAAAGIAYVAHRLRQSPILGYILAGVLIGPNLGLGWVTNAESIDFLSELGLIMLLFMIGLEIDLKKLLQSGRTIVVIGIVQVGLCIALGLGFFGLSSFGDGGTYARLYLAFMFALSSTMIVVKLLYDKFELDTLPGRLTLGVLVMQDLFAIIFLAIQPNLAEPEIGGLALSFLKGAAVIAGCFLASRFLLPYVFRSVARVPELMVVIALAWCFLFSWLAGDVAGLSRAIGALIAGVSLSTFPYNPEITTKITSIRSFFIILFFVSLGMKVTQPSMHIFLLSLLACLFLIASRFVVLFPVLYLQKKGIRVSFLVPLNLAQISEFSLVIAAIGLSYGHINQNVVTIVLFTLMITATTSTYMITYSHKLYLMAQRLLRKLGLKELGMEEEMAETVHPILFLGFYRIASSVLHYLEKENPGIKDKISVVDFNPEVHQELRKRGLRAIYGDLGNTDTLLESGLDKAKVVVSTIPDTILKGTTNMALLSYTKRVNPSARVVVTAESSQMAQRLCAAGADFVLLPHMEASEKLGPLLEQLLADEVPEACLEHRRRIMEHRGEVIE